jgi:hypothetical protein
MKVTMRKRPAFTVALAPRFALSVTALTSWVDTMTTFDFFVGVFIVFGGFGFLALVADYIIPALFENNGMEWDDYSE